MSGAELLSAALQCWRWEMGFEPGNLAPDSKCLCSLWYLYLPDQDGGVVSPTSANFDVDLRGLTTPLRLSWM